MRITQALCIITKLFSPASVNPNVFFTSLLQTEYSRCVFMVGLHDSGHQQLLLGLVGISLSTQRRDAIPSPPLTRVNTTTGLHAVRSESSPPAINHQMFV